jgi:predicted Zn-dependent peptidase
MLNWRPVVDYELREIEFDQREIEYEKRRIAHEQKMRQLDELDSKLDALLCSSSTSSTPPQSTPDNSEA